MYRWKVSFDYWPKDNFFSIIVWAEDKLNAIRRANSLIIKSEKYDITKVEQVDV